MLSQLFSEQKMKEKEIIDTMQEESLVLTEQVEKLREECSNLSTKNLMLEQLNLDLSTKSI